MTLATFHQTKVDRVGGQFDGWSCDGRQQTDTQLWSIAHLHSSKHISHVYIHSNNNNNSNNYSNSDSDTLCVFMCFFVLVTEYHVDH